MTGDDAQYAKAVEATSYWPTREVPGMYEGNDLMTEYGVKTCVYGHLHGKDAFKYGLKGEYNNVEYKLVSLDYLQGRPEEVII